MDKPKEPDGSGPDFVRGMLLALPITIALWSLIIIFGVALGKLVDLLISNLMLSIHAKLAIAVFLIVLGLFALEAILKRIYRVRS